MRVGGDGVIEQLAAGLVLLGLVQVVIERTDQGSDGLAGAQPMVQGGGEVGVFGAGGGLPGGELLRAVAVSGASRQRRGEIAGSAGSGPGWWRSCRAGRSCRRLRRK